MKRQSQGGFSAVEALLLLVILAIIGFTAGYVWHSKQTADKTLNEAAKVTTPANSVKATCSSPDKAYNGIVYKAPANTYSICIPDGWTLYGVANGSAKGSALTGSVDGLVYKSGVAPLIRQAGGGDGARAFSVFFNASYLKPDASYVAEGPAQSVNLQGTKYSYIQKTDPPDGFTGTLPKGTRATIYYFERTNKSIGVYYNIFPGDPDYSALVKSLISTLKFN